jgi:hypothetical protein
MKAILAVTAFSLVFGLSAAAQPFGGPKFPPPPPPPPHGPPGHHLGAPGPVLGAGLPVLAVGAGIFWVARRRRKPTAAS